MSRATKAQIHLSRRMLYFVSGLPPRMQPQSVEYIHTATCTHTRGRTRTVLALDLD